MVPSRTPNRPPIAMSEMITPIMPWDVSNATLHFGNAILVTFETASTNPFTRERDERGFHLQEDAKARHEYAQYGVEELEAVVRHGDEFAKRNEEIDHR